MMQSLRSRLILASILWTAGLLMLMHLLSILLLRHLPTLRGGRHSIIAIFVGLALMAAGIAWARRGLIVPFHALRTHLAGVRSGMQDRIAGRYPTEIQPLIDELNGLLDSREKAVRRAIAVAGDLAHGLKTPLALLSQESARIHSLGGQAEAAGAIAQQVEKMSRQVDYHLARARAASSGPSAAAPCPIAPAVEALVRTLRKLHAARSLTIEVAPIDPALHARIQREDFDEILGNLLDNACKWAASRVIAEVVVTSPQPHQGQNSLTITIDDDGPGLPPHLRAAVLERGVRADQSAPGSGLGLAIARDLAELYSGSIALEDSPLGGLRARFTLL